MRKLSGLILCFVFCRSYAETRFAIGYLSKEQDQQKITEHIRKKYLSNKDVVVDLQSKIFNSELISLALAGQINFVVLPVPEAISLLSRSSEWRIVGRISSQKNDLSSVFLLMIELNFLDHKMNECRKFANEIIQFKKFTVADKSLFSSSELKEIDSLQLSMLAFTQRKILFKDFIMHDFL